MTDTLVDPQTGLVRDGVRLNSDGTIGAVEATTYTYCQGVYLGACVELAERDGHPRWADRAAALLNALAATMVGPDGVIPGFDDGGDGGLFGGILARYLADAAVRLPELAPLATKIVLTSAEAAWHGRTEVAGGPVFAPRWSRPAHEPGPASRSRSLGPTVRLDAPRSRRQSSRHPHRPETRPWPDPSQQRTTTRGLVFRSFVDHVPAVAHAARTARVSCGVACSGAWVAKSGGDDEAAELDGLLHGTTCVDCGPGPHYI
jgi:hypothetical protein